MNKKLFVISTCILILLSCGTKQANKSFSTNKDTAEITKDTLINSDDKINFSETEDRIIDSVMLLPEMLLEDSIMQEKTGGRSRLAAMIIETPEENNQGYYVVKVAEDNDQSLVGLYNFNVYYPSFKIMWVNPIDAEEWSLDKWRKESNFNQ